MFLNFQCLGKLRHDRDEEIHAHRKKHQQQRKVQKSTNATLSKLLSEVQVIAKTLLWNKSYTTNALKCNLLQIQHHCVVCLALRCWNRTWGMFLLSTWGLLKSWRSKASSCLNVWAHPKTLFRMSNVMTLRVSVLYWDELRYQYISSSALNCEYLFLQIHLTDHIHLLFTCMYTSIRAVIRQGHKTSWIRNLNPQPSSPLLFNLLLSFPSFFTICLFLYLSPSLLQNHPCCDSRYVVQCSEIIHGSPPPASPPGKAAVSRDNTVMCPVRHLHTMVTSLPQGLWISSLVIYIAVFVKLQAKALITVSQSENEKICSWLKAFKCTLKVII